MRHGATKGADKAFGGDKIQDEVRENVATIGSVISSPNIDAYKLTSAGMARAMFDRDTAPGAEPSLRSAMAAASPFNYRLAQYWPAAAGGAKRAQQHSGTKFSGTISAFFIQLGGRSSSLTCATGLKNLKLWRVLPALQNATTVSSGGQPGSEQVTSETRTAASGARLKRARVQAATRSSALSWSGLFLADPSIFEQAQYKSINE
jgi:hypothetical protein